MDCWGEWFKTPEIKGDLTTIEIRNAETYNTRLHLIVRHHGVLVLVDEILGASLLEFLDKVFTEREEVLQLVAADERLALEFPNATPEHLAIAREKLVGRCDHCCAI